MLYRFTKAGRRKACDLRDIYSGTIFICGGHPSLKDENLNLFQKPGIVTLAMNNTATLFKPNIWLCADKAMCYSKSILEEPSVMKFTRLLYVDDIIHGGQEPFTRWKHMPNTWFYGLSEHFNYQDILRQDNVFVWWKNVFMISVQLAYYLGFRKIFFCGTGFKVPESQHYSYDVKLSNDLVEYNKRTYHNALGNFICCLPYLREGGLDCYSCTPDSSMNDHIPFRSFNKAIEETSDEISKIDLSNVKHSSETK